MRAVLLVAMTMFGGVAAAQGAETSSGSGVLIGAKGEILTNAHVVEACQTITVKLASGSSESATLVTRDERNDLAVIRLTGTNNPPTSVAVFREGAPVRAGDAIVALGYPLSGLLATDANVSVGNVSALAGVADDSRYFQIIAPVQPGNSGGPLLDTSGHVVGIVTAKLNALRMARFTGDIPENVNFALKTEVARTFLDSKGIGYQTARSDKQLSPADVGEIARPFALYIVCERAGSQSATAAATPSDSSAKKVETTTEQAAKTIGLRGEAYFEKHDYDRAIADYSEAIRLKPSFTVALLNRRAYAYSLKGDLGRAIADYDQVIQLDPKNTIAFYNHGNAYLARGDFDRAIADYDQVIRLDPKLASVYYPRGIASLYVGSLADALTNFERIDAKNPYRAIWLDIVNKRSNVPSRLPQALSQIDMTKWPAPVIRFYLGELTSEALLAAADDPDAVIRKNQVCEANFYDGEILLQQGAKNEATRLFQLAAKDCPKDFVEWWAANAEIKAIAQRH